MLKLLSCVAWMTPLAAATVLVSSIVKQPDINCSETLEFTCDTNLCIPIDKRCDGYNDCWDLSDEMDCEIHLCLEPYWFNCKNKKCISKSFVCDDENDCGDFSDEQNCTSWQTSVLDTFHNCSVNEWKCSDRLCIPTEWVCNGEPDCLDGSDENIGCKTHSVCDGFKCKNSQCIPKEWRCDKTTDCKDASDELNCDILPEDCSLEKGLFQCISDKSCIPISEVCDGVAQCHDKSDESTLCGDTSCKTQSNCSHNCLTTPQGIRCLCPHGYYATDLGNCIDINECEIYGICDQTCRNLQGSYECYCEQKYILQDDKKTCTVKDGEALMIFSTKNEIRGYFLKSQLYFPIAKQLKQAIGVSFDGNYVYWTEISSESESIVRALEDGTHKQVLLTSGLGTPEDISIDWVTGNIYFTDSEMQHIAVCTSEGIYCTILVTQAVHKPRSIVLNPLKGEMYWSDWGNRPEIARANMDGTKDISFVANEIYWPNGLALDMPNQRLYWTDAKSLTIESIQLDGSGRRVIAKGIVKHPYGLAVFENRIYWSDWSTHSIESCDKFTGRDHHILIKQTHEYIYDIHIYHSALQLRRSNNPCKFAFCSDICLLSGKSYSCACPDNKILDSDKHTCKVAVRDQQLIIGTSKSLLLMQYQQLGQHNSTNISVTFENIGALAYNSANHSVFVSDSSSKMLAMVDIYNGHTDYLLSEVDMDIVAMDFDVLGNNLFWCDSKKAVVEVLNLNTMSRKVILNDMVGETPVSIAVVSNEGIIFVAFQTSEHSSHIDRLRMDGSERTHVVDQGLMGPIHLLYDAELHRVFWADSGSGLIESTSTDGDDRHEFRMTEGSPATIASLDKNIFWVNRKSKNLYSASKMDSDKNNRRIAVDIPEKVEILHLIAVTPQKISAHPCQQYNGKCSHLCLPAVGTVICSCPLGMKLENDNKTCTKPRFCALNEFLCQQSNICISNTMYCDHRRDCIFGEDEKDCEIRNQCPSGNFQCHNNECIKENLICDKHYDCKDNSDEASCAATDNIDPCIDRFSNCDTEQCLKNRFLCNNGSITCNVNHFRCNSGACIPKNWECDHEFDCRDSSDEHQNCGYTVCQSPKFQCSNRLCIDSVLKCNGVNDCGDYSDEINCVAVNQKFTCKPSEFHCYSNNSLCLPISSRCNGTSECPHHEDEQGCSNCHMDKFECNNKKCINREWLCDHVDDCGDNSDEKLYMCLHEHTVLSHNSSCDKQYRCKNGQCIDMSVVCNANDDCGDGSDEDGACVLACDAHNNPCSHICMRTPTGPQCDCNSGFKLRGDGRTCTDVKECLLEPPVCSQNCNEISGSFTCSCYDGYILRADGTSCKTIEDGMSLIFATSKELYRLFYGNNTLQLLQSNEDVKITGIDISAKKELLYFSTESGKLYRLNLLHQTQEYISDVGKPQNLAVEWISENIYFVNDDLTSKSIRVCNFEKRSCADVVNINYHTKVLALAIDAVNNYIFYSQSSSWKSFNSSPNAIIYKCKLDGSNLQQLFSSNSEYITGLTLDVRKNVLYYGDSYNGRIFKIHYDGRKQAEIISNLTRPMSLSVFENHLYFYTAGGYMTMCPLFKNYQACKSYRVYGRFNEMFVILHTSRQPVITNVCENNNCTYMCVPKNNTVQCLCNSNLIKSSLLQCQTKQVMTVDSEQSKYENKTEISSRQGHLTIILIVITSLFAAITCVSGYYYFHKKRSGNFSISMRFQNPVYGYIEENSQQIAICPGQHEYYNPINSIVVDELKN